MTEEEWLATGDPAPHLQYFWDRASDGQFRLFAVACCRGIWEWVTDRRIRQAIETAEGYADGVVKGADLWAVRGEAAQARNAVLSEGSHIYHAARATVHALDWQKISLRHVAHEVRLARRDYSQNLNGSNDSEAARDAVKKQVSREAELVREIFGNPFRPVAFDPEWRTSDVAALATGIDEERAFDQLPILADALQDAGCDAEELLSHLRDPNVTHVRGCWALDLVLGKE